MFTGLIQAVGRITSITPTGDGAACGSGGGGGGGGGARIEIDPGGWSHRPNVGDSIAISGCCLTLAEPVTSAGRFLFDAVRETLDRTTLGSLAPGHRVNLEHAVRADTLMGGHFVQGHIEGLATVARVQRKEADWRISFTAPDELMDATIPKGSIAIDGVSLTVARVDRNTFEVALIPTTLELTTLGDLREGDRVNIETDMLARAAVHALRRISSD